MGLNQITRVVFGDSSQMCRATNPDLFLAALAVGIAAILTFGVWLWRKNSNGKSPRAITAEFIN